MTVDYENEECPEGCSTVHEVPPRGEVTCPETSEHFIFCDECEDWFFPGDYPEHTSLRHQRRLIAVCDPDAHGFVRCSRCEQWIVEADANEACYSSQPFCDPCWNEMGGCDCRDCGGYEPDYDDYEYHIREGEHVRVCNSCKEPNTILDLLSEEFCCPCAMQAWLTQQPDRPFLVSARA